MKFKIGDLVQLSAAGKSVDQNSHMIGGFGIVTFIGESYASFPIKAEWYNGVQHSGTTCFKAYELKFYKKRT